MPSSRALVERVHDQHQHPDGVLAGRDHEPRRVPRAAARVHAAAGRDHRSGRRARALRRRRLGGAPQFGCLGLRGAGGRRPRGPCLGELADGRRVARPAPVGALRVRARRRVSPRRGVAGPGVAAAIRTVVDQRRWRDARRLLPPPRPRTTTSTTRAGAGGRVFDDDGRRAPPWARRGLPWRGAGARHPSLLAGRARGAHAGAARSGGDGAR